jgi:drug/metabolite transporter (DMT)-like permease
MKVFHVSGQNTRGILCLMGAVIFLTGSDSIIKWLSPHYALHEIMLFRACFAMVVVLFIVKLEGGLVTLKTRRPLLHLFRGLLLVLANVFFFLGLATMPMAETVALFFVAPLFICLLAKPFLGETVGVPRWSAIFVGLCGVLIMLRPGTELFKLSSMLPIMAALIYAVMQMITRKLGMHDTAGTLTFYIQIAFILVSSTMGLTVGDGSFNDHSNQTTEFLLRAWVWPVANDLALLGVCGVVVAFGGYLMSQAYRIAEASVVAPFEYTSLPFALIVGYLLWGDWPDLVSIAGSLLIIMSGLLIVYFENRTKPGQPKKVRISRQP